MVQKRWNKIDLTSQIAAEAAADAEVHNEDHLIVAIVVRAGQSCS